MKPSFLETYESNGLIGRKRNHKEIFYIKFLNIKQYIILVNGMEHMSDLPLLLTMLANSQTTWVNMSTKH